LYTKLATNNPNQRLSNNKMDYWDYTDEPSTQETSTEERLQVKRKQRIIIKISIFKGNISSS
jgi:hypothetical protein